MRMIMLMTINLRKIRMPKMHPKTTRKVIWMTERLQSKKNKAQLKAQI